MRKINTSGYVSFFSFALVLALLEVSARLAAPSLPVDPGKWPRAEIAQKLDQIDDMLSDGETAEVLFVGSSQIAGGINPVLFTESSGVTSYNAGFGGPATRTLRAWTTDILEPLLHPKVVVLGIQSRDVNDNAPKGEDIYNKFITSPGYKQAASSVTNRLEGQLEALSFFLRYRRAFRSPADLFSSDAAALEDAKVSKELGPRGKRIDHRGTYRATDRFLSTLYRKTLIDFSVGGVEYDALLQLHEDLEARGVRLVVMSMPVTADYDLVHADPAGAMAAYHELLDRFASETGVTVINAEDAFLNPEVFRDPVHLDVDARDSFARTLADAWPSLMESEGDRWRVVCDESEAPTCEIVR